MQRCLRPICRSGIQSDPSQDGWRRPCVASADRVPAAARAGVEIAHRVREIATDAHGVAPGVVYYDEDRKEQFRAAHVIVLARNGVGTPRHEDTIFVLFRPWN
jgi:hypothetical protein